MPAQPKVSVNAFITDLPQSGASPLPQFDLDTAELNQYPRKRSTSPTIFSPR
jgi:hypothetical protein